MTTDTLVNPSIVVDETVVASRRIIFIRDTVPLAGLRQFFTDSYAELFPFAMKYRPGARKAMAFYDNYNDPVSIEAAVEVDTIPGHLPGRILTRIVEGGKAAVIHYTGPYDAMEESYNALARWLKKNNKQPKGMPFEVYLNNPGMVKDSSELRTDIYQLLQ